MSGVIGYLYESAKDSIKWHNKKPKEFINLVMMIGRLRYMPEKEFKKIDNKDDSDLISLDQLNNLAIAMQKTTKEK